MRYTAVKRTLTYSAATGHVSTETVIEADIDRARVDRLLTRRLATSGQEYREGDEGLVGVTRTYVDGVLQVPAHEDETDCPNPAQCRAHDWLVRS